MKIFETLKADTEAAGGGPDGAAEADLHINQSAGHNEISFRPAFGSQILPFGFESGVSQEYGPLDL